MVGSSDFILGSLVHLQIFFKFCSLVMPELVGAKDMLKEFPRSRCNGKDKIRFPSQQVKKLSLQVTTNILRKIIALTKYQGHG